MGKQKEVFLPENLLEELRSIEELLLDEYLNVESKSLKNIEKLKDSNDAEEWNAQASKTLKAYDLIINRLKEKEKKLDEQIIKALDEIHGFLLSKG